MNGNRLHLIVVERGCSVSANRSELLLVATFHRSLDGSGQTHALRRWRDEMAGVVACCSVHEVPIEPLSNVPEPLRRLAEDNRGRRFAWIEAVTFHVEWAARLFRNGLKGLETSHNELALYLCSYHDGVVVEVGRKQMVGKELC